VPLEVQVVGSFQI